MKRPAVFFDRDNTLIVSDGYLGDPAKVALIPGAADAVAKARALGYAVVVFSNQSGVARGMFSEEDVQAVNARMDELLAAENAGAIVDRHEFCPFHPEGTVDVYARESDRRKPSPGMIHSAAKSLALDLERSWVVGDAARDIEAGRAAGCRAILFTDPSLRKSPAAEGRPNVDPDYTVTTLGEAIDYIEKGPAAQRAPVAEPTPVREETPPVATAPTVVEAPVAESPAPAKRVPKVAIGSKYVPPEGKESVTATAREPAPERPAAAATRKVLQRAADEAPRPAPPPETGNERMESMLEQIFLELRRQHEHGDSEFSVSKLLAGVVQVIVLAVLFLGYLKRADVPTLQTHLLLASVLQTLTISLLIMSRQK